MYPDNGDCDDDGDPESLGATAQETSVASAVAHAVAVVVAAHHNKYLRCVLVGITLYTIQRKIFCDCLSESHLSLHSMRKTILCTFDLTKIF